MVIRTLVEAVLNSYMILSLSYCFISPCYLKVNKVRENGYHERAGEFLFFHLCSKDFNLFFLVQVDDTLSDFEVLEKFD